MNSATRAAMAMAWTGGKLSRVRTYQRTFKMSGTFDMVPAERRWAPCRMSYTIGVRWPMRIDPVHWDHWALSHGPACGDTWPCRDCGGTVCPRESENWPDAWSMTFGDVSSASDP